MAAYIVWQLHIRFKPIWLKNVWKGKKAGLFWSVAGTTALVNLWGGISMQRQLDGARRNRPVCQRLQQDLAALGFIQTLHCPERMWATYFQFDGFFFEQQWANLSHPSSQTSSWKTWRCMPWRRPPQIQVVAEVRRWCLCHLGHLLLESLNGQTPLYSLLWKGNQKAVCNWCTIGEKSRN